MSDSLCCATDSCVPIHPIFHSTFNFSFYIFVSLTRQTQNPNAMSLVSVKCWKFISEDSFMLYGRKCNFPNPYNLQYAIINVFLSLSVSPPLTLHVYVCVKQHSICCLFFSFCLCFIRSCSFSF